MKKLLFLGIVVILGALLVITCPDREKHVEAIDRVIDYSVNRAAEESGSAFSDEYLGTLLISQLSSLAVESFLEVDNYFVVSIGRLAFPGEEPQTISVGLLGHVFTVDKEEAYKLLTSE